MEIRIRAFLAAQKELEHLIKKSSKNISFTAFESLYKNHQKILKAFEILQNHYLQFQGVEPRDDYFLEINKKSITVLKDRADDEH